MNLFDSRWRGEIRRQSKYGLQATEGMAPVSASETGVKVGLAVLNLELQ